MPYTLAHIQLHIKKLLNNLGLGCQTCVQIGHDIQKNYWCTLTTIQVDKVHDDESALGKYSMKALYSS